MVWTVTSSPLSSTPFTELHYKVWEQGSKNLPLNLGVIGKSIKYVMAGQPPVPGVLNVPGPMGTGGGFLYGVLSAIEEELGLDSIAFLPLEEMLKVAPDANCGFCIGCFTGEYPVDITKANEVVKFNEKLF